MAWPCRQGLREVLSEAIEWAAGLLGGADETDEGGEADEGGEDEGDEGDEGKAGEDCGALS